MPSRLSKGSKEGVMRRIDTADRQAMPGSSWRSQKSLESQLCAEFCLGCSDMGLCYMLWNNLEIYTHLERQVIRSQVNGVLAAVDLSTPKAWKGSKKPCPWFFHETILFLLTCKNTEGDAVKYVVVWTRKTLRHHLYEA